VRIVVYNTFAPNLHDRAPNHFDGLHAASLYCDISVDIASNL